MLSGGEGPVKGASNSGDKFDKSKFAEVEETPIRDQGDIPNPRIDYQTLEEVPICEKPGGKGVQNVLEDGFRVWVIPEDHYREKEKPEERKDHFAIHPLTKKISLDDPFVSKAKNPPADNEGNNPTFQNIQASWYVTSLDKAKKEIAKQYKDQIPKEVLDEKLKEFTTEELPPYKWCKDPTERDSEGRDPLYVYTRNRMVDNLCVDEKTGANRCDAYGMESIDIELTEDEKMLLVKLANLDPGDYGFSKDWVGRMHLKWNEDGIKNIKSKLTEFSAVPANQSRLNSTRPKAIIDAIDRAFQPYYQSLAKVAAAESEARTANNRSYAIGIGGFATGVGLLITGIFGYIIGKKQLKMTQQSLDIALQQIKIAQDGLEEQRKALDLQEEQFKMYKEEMGDKPKEPILPRLTDMVDVQRQRLTADPNAKCPVSPRLYPKILELAGSLTKGELANPNLLAENGVGKSAAVEGLAYFIAKGQLSNGQPIPVHLRNARILFVDASREFLTDPEGKYRSVIEAKFRRFVDEVIAANQEAKRTGSPRVVPFIDENHVVFNTGSDRVADLSTIVKPALARGSDFQYIGATTPQEYQRYIAPDGATASRNPPVMIPTPNEAEAIADLKYKKGELEVKYGRRIADGTIEEVVKSSRFDQGNYPRKAFDLMQAVVADMNNVRGIPDDVPISAEEVRRFVAWKNEGFLAQAVDEAAKDIDTIDPTERMKIVKQSIVDGLRKSVRNFSSLPEAEQTRLEKIILTTWETNPALQSFMEETGATGDQKYRIPQSFVDKVLVRLHSQGGLPAEAQVAAAITNPAAPPRAQGRRGREFERPNRIARHGGASIPRAEEGFSLLNFLKNPFRVAAGALPLAVAEIAAHKDVGLITKGQKNAGLFGFLGISQALNPYTLTHLGLMTPGFVAGQKGAQALEKKVGIDPEGVTATALETVGGVAGAAAEAKGYAFVRNAFATEFGYKTVSTVEAMKEATYFVQHGIGEGMRRIGLSHMVDGLRQANTMARQAVVQLGAGATALFAGARVYAAVAARAIPVVGAITTGASVGYGAGTLANERLENFAEENHLGSALDLGTFELPENTPVKYKQGNWKFLAEE